MLEIIPIVCPAKWKEGSETLKPSLDLVGKIKERIYDIRYRIKNQLAEYLKLLEGDVLIKVSVGDDSVSKDIISLVEELALLSPKIKTEEAKLPRTPS